MDKNYSYPLNPDWTTEELITVTKMFQLVEDAYEVGADKQAILAQYKLFKEIVNSKAEEKQLGREFKQSAGYELYDVVQAARQTTRKIVKLG